MGATGSFSSGSITDNGALCFDNSGTTTLTYLNPISGSGSLTQMTGVLTLGGADTYTGGTTISGGTLQVDASNALPSAGAVTLANVSGATLALGDSSATIGSLSGGGPSGGNVSLGSGMLTIWGSGTTTYAGVISGLGAAGLTLRSAGTLILTGDNTYTGITTISGGTLQLGNGSTPGSISGASSITDNGVLAVDNPGTTTFWQPISGSGGLTQMAGTLVLTGTDTCTGATTINADSTLQLGNGGTTGSINSGITDNGALVFDLSSDTFSQGISGSGGLTQMTGTLILTSTDMYTGSTTINPGSVLQVGNGSTAGSIAWTSGIADNGILQFDNPETTTLGTMSPISGGGGLTQMAGTLVLDSTDIYTGLTTISGGTLELNSVGSAQNSIVSVSGGTLTFGVTAVTIGGLEGNGNVSLTDGASAVALTVSGNSSTYSGVLSGSGGLTVSGGTLTLTNTSNSYTGGTTISGGVLSIDNDHELGIGGGVTLGGGTLQTTAGISSARTITVGALGGTVDTDGSESTFTGPISGSGLLTVTN